MATKNTDNRQSYFLNVTPVNYSLTEGTDIPPPAPSPHRSPSLAEPPTPGGGPLSSHPTTPPSERGDDNKPSTADTVTRDRSDSFRTPTSPASAAQMSPNAQRPKGVRKLLSLSNLRSSFSSSRTSLSLPKGSSEAQPNSNQAPTSASSIRRPVSPGAASSLAPSMTTSTTVTGPPVRQKKSGNWFKRKSSLFLLNGDLDTVEEGRPDTRESKRLKESPAPLLPEIGALKGGRMSNGDLGWDEQAFKRDIAT